MQDGLLSLDDYSATAGDRRRTADDEALGFVQPHASILRHKVAAVLQTDIDSLYVQDVIDRLFAAARGQRQTTGSRKKGRKLVGLAAPQIGEPIRVVLIDTRISADRKRAGKLECFINPEIIWRSRETEEGREGCFSAGSVWGLVRRPIAVKIRALDRQGQQIERILEGFTARIAQHEIDHLDGIRFPERITSDKKRHWVHAEELPLYPKLSKRWRRLCTKARWRHLIQGSRLATHTD